MLFRSQELPVLQSFSTMILVLKLLVSVLARSRANELFKKGIERGFTIKATISHDVDHRSGFM